MKKNYELNRIKYLDKSTKKYKPYKMIRMWKQDYLNYLRPAYKRPKWKLLNGS